MQNYHSKLISLNNLMFQFFKLVSPHNTYLILITQGHTPTDLILNTKIFFYEINFGLASMRLLSDSMQ